MKTLRMLTGAGKRIAVVGAGAVGLSSAVCIQNLLPKASVTVIADKFNAETTSDGAPAIFGPDVKHELYRTLCEGSANWYQERCYAEDAHESGVFLTSGYYQVSTEGMGVDDLPFKDFLPACRKLTKSELSSLPSKPKDGFFCTTYMIECRRYLPYLMNRFKRNGGAVIQQTIQNISELKDYDVSVLCTGLGSRELAGDPELVPCRGQTMRLSAPWLKHFYATDDFVYVMPCYDNVFVGVTKQFDNFNPNPTEPDRKYIWDSILKQVPGLKGSEVEREWVGFRPWREAGLRLEKDTVVADTKQISVVYNYGHGSNGVGLSWGSGLVAAELTASIFDNDGTVC